VCARPYANRRIVEIRQEGKVALVGRQHQVAEVRREAIDRLFQGSDFEELLSIALFYRPVVLQKGDVRGGHFQAEDDPERVIEFQAHWAHVVFEPGAFEAGGEGGPEWSVIPPRQLAAQERGHVVGFDGMDGGPAQDLVEILERRLVRKENVRGVFHLHETPVVLHAKGLEDRTIFGGELVQGPMQRGDLPRIGELLGPGKIVDHGEGIVRQVEGEAFAL
jgi:hypothetical protein